MKKKYVPISGFAFGEKADFAKLERLARQGWILDGINMFFYRLKKEEPQTIVYSLDYRSDCDDEYFAIFQAAVWTHRATLADTHIFSAPEGTTPLYLDAAEQSEQYLPIIRETAKGSAVSFLFLILLGILRHIGSPLTGLLLSSWCCLFWPGLSLCSTLCRAWATYLEDCARFEPGDERVHTGYGEVSVVLKCS